MTKLTDTQAILLSTASQRDHGSVLPLPASLKAGGGTSKAMAALLRRGLVEERETDEATAIHRTDGDHRFGLFLTAAGAAAIGVAAGDQGSAEGRGTGAEPKTTISAEASAPRPSTKAATVLALLSRADGASLAELIEATGWLPHTTRAALTGLRKKGHDIARSKRDGATCYRIAEQA